VADQDHPVAVVEAAWKLGWRRPMLASRRLPLRHSGGHRCARTPQTEASLHCRPLRHHNNQKLQTLQPQSEVASPRKIKKWKIWSRGSLTNQSLQDHNNKIPRTTPDRGFFSLSTPATIRCLWPEGCAFLTVFPFFQSPSLRTRRVGNLPAQLD